MTYLAIALIVVWVLLGLMLVAIGGWMRATDRRLDALERSAPIEDTETEIPDEPVSDQFPVIHATDLGRGMP